MNLQRMGVTNALVTYNAFQRSKRNTRLRNPFEAPFNPQNKLVGSSNDIYDEVICLYDTDRDLNNKTLKNVLSDDELNIFFSKIKSKGQTLIFDCCLSGGLVSRKPLSIQRFKNSLNFL